MVVEGETALLVVKAPVFASTSQPDATHAVAWMIRRPYNPNSNPAVPHVSREGTGSCFDVLPRRLSRGYIDDDLATRNSENFQSQ